jgi:signal transduction histidine kinase
MGGCAHGAMIWRMASVDVSSGQPGNDESVPPEGAAPASSQRSGRIARGGQPLRRYPDRGLVGGVCAGLAEHFGLNVAFVRGVVALLIAFGGIGLGVYAVAWALIPVAPESAGVPRRPGAWREGVLIVLAVGALIALVWRPTLIADPTRSRRRQSLRDYVRHPSHIDAPRVVIGVVLVAFAVASLLHSAGVLGSLGKALGAVAVVATVLGLLLAPWLVRTWRSLAFERAARIREQERTELAAHLHDSVLQTLALIQKRAGDPREVAGLARTQERELRRWLRDGSVRDGEETVASALARAAAEVEELHRVPIEVVTVGDGPLDGRLEAVVQAAREAMTNAAKFAGSERVDLYAEVEPDHVEVFVRDRGVGFDAAAIPDDRSGVRDSIIGRMERNGGRATVRSTADEGTEVELTMSTGATA